MGGQLERCGRDSSPKRLRLGLIPALHQVAGSPCLGGRGSAETNVEGVVWSVESNVFADSDDQTDSKRIDSTSPRPAVESRKKEIYVVKRSAAADVRTTVFTSYGEGSASSSSADIIVLCEVAERFVTSSRIAQR